MLKTCLKFGCFQENFQLFILAQSIVPRIEKILYAGSIFFGCVKKKTISDFFVHLIDKNKTELLREYPNVGNGTTWHFITGPNQIKGRNKQI